VVGINKCTSHGRGDKEVKILFWLHVCGCHSLSKGGHAVCGEIHKCIVWSSGHFSHVNTTWPSDPNRRSNNKSIWMLCFCEWEGNTNRYKKEFGGEGARSRKGQGLQQSTVFRFLDDPMPSRLVLSFAFLH
jgi:hypothetical protein